MGRQIEQHIIARRIELQLNELRAIKHLMDSGLFIEVYEAANEEARMLADKMIENKDHNALKLWLRERRHNCIESCSLRELREKAREAQLENYSRLNKPELMRRLKQTGDNK